MKTRQTFDAEFNATIQARIREAANFREEAIFLIDTMAAAQIFLSGIIQRGIQPKPAVGRIVLRLEKVANLMSDANNKPKRKLHIEGDPEPDPNADPNTN